MTKKNKGLINELTALEDIESLENKYLELYGASPYNISHWDPSQEFQSQLYETLELSTYTSYFDYTFSYSLPTSIKSQLLQKFKFSPEIKGCLVTPSGSVSILCIVNWLKFRGYKKITVLCPAYFTLFHACLKEQIHIEIVFMKRLQDEYSIPLEEVYKKDLEVLWVTNPVYCTGVSLTYKDIKKLEQLLNSGVTIIADECRCLSR